MAEGALIDAKALLNRLEVDAGHKVADLGTGRQSEFIVEAAGLVGDKGKVYAVDIVKDVLAAVEERMQALGIGNVETVWTDLEKYGAAKAIVDGSLDEALLITTLFLSSDKEAMVKEADRMVKPGGKVLVVEWKPGDTPIGPPVEERLDEEEVGKLADSVGWKKLEGVKVGPYHWGMIFTK